MIIVRQYPLCSLDWCTCRCAIVNACIYRSCFTLLYPSHCTPAAEAFPSTHDPPTPCATSSTNGSYFIQSATPQGPQESTQPPQSSSRYISPSQFGTSNIRSASNLRSTSNTHNQGHCSGTLLWNSENELVVVTAGSPMLGLHTESPDSNDIQNQYPHLEALVLDQVISTGGLPKEILLSLSQHSLHQSLCNEDRVRLSPSCFLPTGLIGGLTELMLLDKETSMPLDINLLGWLNAVAQLRGLQRLHLRLMPTKQQLLALTPLKHLTYLVCHVQQSRPWEVSSSAVGGDAGIEVLARSFPQLRHFNIGQSGSHDFTHAAISSLATGPTCLVRLDVSGCSRITDHGLKALQGISTLQHVDLSQCLLVSDEGLLHLTTSTQLQTLNVVGCWKITLEVAGPVIGRSWPALHTLGLQDTLVKDAGIKACWQGFDLERREVCVQGSPNCGDNAMHKSSMPALRCLSLSRLWGIKSCQGVVSLRLGSPNLTRLDLGHTNISDPDCSHLAHLTALRFLDITYTHVGDQGVSVLAQALHNLLKWVLNRLSRLSDEGLHSISQAAKGLSSLRYLSMKSCRGVSEQAVMGVWRALPRIQRLDVEGSWHVKPATIERLKRGLGVPGLDAFELASSRPLWASGLGGVEAEESAASIEGSVNLWRQRPHLVTGECTHLLSPINLGKQSCIAGPSGRGVMCDTIGIWRGLSDLDEEALRVSEDDWLGRL
ncbi:hypothetical protein CEUSTIGMA_g12597.t1 [Chlamydomonas eustigma]|uniref:Uncharacterized protein n=1 Tax=Chlamydomonas eustigma TaxID=1157962 RepID=A0A250XQF3_9CHLO|nr:hypothetical protein CEUSTIGMA_g12597.t1 [Chlamydomonas eustigma]|eukprot:GAX85179.1 hypothetical protein CEUSTIGMA_g12597.t1 [Chlamydomonas eustigma]